MDEFDFEDGPIVISYDNVMRAKDFLPITRTLAMDLSESGYIRPGDFLKSLTDADVDALLKVADN
jgi:hypothetical protein